MADDRTNQLSADAAVLAAAQLAQAIATIEANKDGGHGIDDSRGFIMDEFARCLDELMGHRGHAASLEQIRNSRP